MRESSFKDSREYHVNLVRFYQEISGKGRDYLKKDNVYLDLKTLNNLENAVDNILYTLTFKERKIIKIRYGLVPESYYAIKEVGRIAKKINEEALKKLHSWYCLQTLEDFSRGIIIPKRTSVKDQKAALKELSSFSSKRDYLGDLIKERQKERGLGR